MNEEQIEKEDRLEQLAINYLLDLFSDGKVRKPTDLEKECWGFNDVNFLAYGPQWNRTHWKAALTTLVEHHKIIAKQNIAGEWLYSINSHLETWIK